MLSASRLSVLLSQNQSIPNTFPRSYTQASTVFPSTQNHNCLTYLNLRFPWRAAIHTRLLFHRVFGFPEGVSMCFQINKPWNILKCPSVSIQPEVSIWMLWFCGSVLSTLTHMRIFPVMKDKWGPCAKTWNLYFSLSHLQALASHRGYLLSARIPTKVRRLMMRLSSYFPMCLCQNQILSVKFDLGWVVLGLKTKTHHTPPSHL